MQLSAIAAIGPHGEIGLGGNLPWPYLRPDMQWFVRQTRGKPVIMGRATWDSLPNRPLPGRPNLVLTRDPGNLAPPTDPEAWPLVAAVTSPDAALDRAAALAAAEAVVIGGGQVYAALLPRVTRIYLTRVSAGAARFGADCTFPDPLSSRDWAERAAGPAAYAAGHCLNFSILERRV